MSIFSKNKAYDTEDVGSIKISERDVAINALEKRRYEINSEIEEIIKSYAKLIKRRELSRRRYKMGHSPNDIKPR